MFFFGVNRRYQHLKRYHQIAETFLRHGFGYLIEQMDLYHLLPLRRRVFKLERESPPIPRGRRLRLALEELGPTFIKLGQLLSTRPDLFSADIIAELEKLQDDVPEMPFATVRRIIEEEMDCPLGEAFDWVDEVPMAAASIGQVHRAAVNGEQVVIKVMRPGIHQIVETDLEIMYGLARMARDRYKTDFFDPVELVGEFARVMRRELDYTVEARNISRFRDNFASDPRIHIPRVYWDHTTSRLLTMEFIQGTKVNQKQELLRRGIDVAEIARRGARCFMQQIMIHGFFHGDPHPGNILIEDDGTIAFIDFGMVGRLDEEIMNDLAELFIAVIRQNVSGIVEGLRAIGMFSSTVNENELKNDIKEIIDRHYGRALKNIKIGNIISDILRLTHKHCIRMPVDFVLLGKALLTVEGIARELDPDFNVIEIAEPFARELLRRQYRPDRLLQRAAGEGKEYAALLLGLPAKLDTTLDRINQNELQVSFKHQGLEKLIIRLDIASNRLAFALIIAALVIGSSLIVQTNKGPALLGFPMIGVIGFIVAAVFGIWLVISILRSGRL